MKLTRIAIFLTLVAGLGAPAALAERPESAWVTTAPDGTLQYATDAEGDRIPDFSSAGYRGGLERIPTAAVQVVVNPGAGDDSARIQAAIDQVSALPIGVNGLRGAVLLTRGQYEVASTLRIRAEGVVLRGEGQYGNGTVLLATGTTQRPALQIVGADTSPFWTRVNNSTVNIADPLVPVGATSFNVAAGHSFAPGDNIVINRGSTQAWFEDIGVDHLDNPWQPGTKDLRFDRTITAVHGNTITIDAPVVNALEQGDYGSMTVYKYTFPDRLQNVGVENLRFVSQTDGTADDENHAWTAIEIDGVEDAWVRQVDAKNFGYAAVSTGETAKSVTVEDVSYLEPVSTLGGGRRYSFAIDSSETLVQRVFAEDGRHDFVHGSNITGPNVLLFATAEDANNDSGPHHRWAAGTLFDNVHVSGDNINARWRGNSGSGHGWAGANMVIWNSFADQFLVHNPPTAQNWVIGATGGPVEVGTWRISEYNGTIEIGNVDSPGTPVAPNSLYIAQLRERIAAFAAAQGDAPLVAVQQKTLLAGDIDGFVNHGAADQFHVNADFLYGANETSSVTQGTFDSTQSGRKLAFTFDYELAEDAEIIGATLVMGLKALDAGYDDDVLRLDNHAARFHLTDTLDVPTNLQAGNEYALVLDLADFFGPLLAPMQDGRFNVMLSDSHAIDFATLTLDIASAPRPGDITLDGLIDPADLGVLAAHWQGTNQTWITGDVTGDGVVNEFDLALMAANWDDAQGSFAEAIAATSFVPEPSSLVMTLGCGAVLLPRRRRSP